LPSAEIPNIGFASCWCADETLEAGAVVPDAVDVVGTRTERIVRPERAQTRGTSSEVDEALTIPRDPSVSGRLELGDELSLCPRLEIEHPERGHAAGKRLDRRTMLVRREIATVVGDGDVLPQSNRRASERDLGDLIAAVVHHIDVTGEEVHDVRSGGDRSRERRSAGELSNSAAIDEAQDDGQGAHEGRCFRTCHSKRYWSTSHTGR
jgi:hypothetical protein